MPFPRAQAFDSNAHWSTLIEQYDAVIYLGPEGLLSQHPQLTETFATMAQVDQRVGKQVVLVHAAAAPGQRLVIAPTGPLERDYDDVRRYADAAEKAIRVACDAGSRRPALVVVKPDSLSQYQHAAQVAYLAACQALWQPLEARERLVEAEIEPVEFIGMQGVTEDEANWLNAVEEGRRLARDLCGTNPERMSAIRFAEYCVEAFKDVPVQVEVLGPEDNIQQTYPLLFSVARASMDVARHHPRVVRLHYKPEGTVKQTLLFAGKGVVYDTGGADLKTDGHMAGMSRDKGGAAAVAGFVKTVGRLAPKGLEVIAELGLVRNSIGADALVADEIIRCHAGVDVRIGNTDAEGRLVLADLLSHLREDALQREHVELFSIATLTGHAARAVGPYTALVSNGPAHAQGKATRLSAIGDNFGDPCEISRSRREDFAFVAPRSAADDVLSSNNAASAVTARGHQFPQAFLTIASGLDKHGINSQHPLAYTHIDIAGSGVQGGDWQHGKPSGAPVLCLAARYLLD